MHGCSHSALPVPTRSERLSNEQRGPSRGAVSVDGINTHRTRQSVRTREQPSHGCFSLQRFEQGVPEGYEAAGQNIWV